MVQAAGSSATAIATQPVRSIQVPIEQVPLGARVPTKNPRPWEYDDSLLEPNEATWAAVSFTVERSDGGVVDAELLRPRSWIKRYGIEAGQLLPLNIEELQIQAVARVNSVTAAPRIASGEGSAVTGRFITRQVDIIARIEVLAADGRVENIQGTTIHPVWSLDRDDWVPLGELEQGEHLLGAAGPAVVLSHAILQRSTPVYNIEVRGEHVYEVGELGLLVHNANECFRVMDGAEYAGARLGKWADSADDWKGFKWTWGSSGEAESWLSFLRQSGETSGFITRIDTLQDISNYKAFDHFPQGIARLIPLDELGKAVRLLE